MIDVKWDKYTYVCSDCDALTEITTVKNLKEYRGWCSCGSANLLWLSVEDATILPNQTKGNEMLDNLESNMDVSNAYNPNLLVTYKKIEGDATSYVTDKVTQIEWDLDVGRKNSASYYSLRNKIDELSEQVAEWHNPNYSKEEVLEGLCEFFGINPTKTVIVNAQVNVQVAIEVPIAEYEDFDASDYLTNELTIDAYSTDLRIESWDVEHIEWDVQ